MHCSCHYVVSYKLYKGVTWNNAVVFDGDELIGNADQFLQWAVDNYGYKDTRYAIPISNNISILPHISGPMRSMQLLHKSLTRPISMIMNKLESMSLGLYCSCV